MIEQLRTRILPVLLLGLATPALPADDLPLEHIELPPGFTISVWADDVPGARSLTLSDQGVVYVGTMRAGKVYAVRDTDGDGTADATTVVDEELFVPNGVAWRDGSLWVAEINRVLRYDGIDDRLADPPDPVVVKEELPADRHHGWKFIRFGPDGKLYVPVGAPCNICDPELPYSAIHRMNPDGSGFETYVRGVRHTVGFDWRPGTGELWFTDNGRDMMGDDIPPDELNRVTGPGLHFGYPYCHAGEISDPEFGAKRACADTVAPARKLGPHVAAIGMRFYTGDQFPDRYRGQIFIAEHGSWNRSQKIGYRVSMVTVDEQGAATSYEPFAHGWLQGQENWGRPVDVQQLPDGSLLVSDDQAGVIYRIVYEG
ncbi:MAG TPA: PQQ-dependent sugar dehydrogenase [Thermoanaerobaculia bacterium]|nr:PQQ-dependent sugar dehydrogenase [Thermoanaerobaculia bacterium]